MLAVRNWNLVVFLSTIAIITFVGICLLASWLIWEMGKAKRVLNEIRSEAATDNKGKTNETEKCWYLWLKKIFSWLLFCWLKIFSWLFFSRQKVQDRTDDVISNPLEKLIKEYEDEKDKMEKSWYLRAKGTWKIKAPNQ